MGIFLEGRSYHHYNKFDLIGGESGGIATRQKHPGKNIKKQEPHQVQILKKDVRMPVSILLFIKTGKCLKNMTDIILVEHNVPLCVRQSL